MELLKSENIARPFKSKSNKLVAAAEEAAQIQKANFGAWATLAKRWAKARRIGNLKKHESGVYMIARWRYRVGRNQKMRREVYDQWDLVSRRVRGEPFGWWAYWTRERVQKRAARDLVRSIMY